LKQERGSRSTTHSAHMKIELIIDTREGALFECVYTTELGDKPITVVKQALELGDVHIVMYKDGAIVRTLVLERKTLCDMVSSINDGRYREQKARVLSNVDSKNVVYIVEGDSLCASLGRDKKNVSSAYLNMIFRDDIHLIFTKNVSETAGLITSLCLKIIDKPGNYLCRPVGDTPGGGQHLVSGATDYTRCMKLKTKKNLNITPQNCFILQLSQVPTISHVIAKNITAVYPSIAKLVAVMARCTTSLEKVKLLSSIDKVGKIKAAKLVEYMHL